MALTVNGKFLMNFALCGGVLDSAAQSQTPPIYLNGRLINMQGTQYEETMSGGQNKLSNYVAKVINSNFLTATSDPTSYRFHVLAEDILSNVTLGTYGIDTSKAYRTELFRNKTATKVVVTPNAYNTQIAFTVENSGSTPETFNYYCICSHDNSSTTLDFSKSYMLQYIEFDEPLVVPAGESRTINITLDLSNV